VTTEEEPASRGVIAEVLPRAMFLVRLDDGRTVRAGIRAAARHATVRFIAGDSVLVRLSPYDLNRGQILKKL